MYSISLQQLGSHTSAQHLIKIPYVLLAKSTFSYGILLVFPWFSHGFPVVCPGFPIVDARGSGITPSHLQLQAQHAAS